MYREKQILQYRLPTASGVRAEVDIVIFFTFAPKTSYLKKKIEGGGGSSYAHDHHHYIIIFIIIADFLMEHNCDNCRKGYV